MKKFLYSQILVLSFLLAGVSYAQLPAPTLIYPPNGDTTVPLTFTFQWSNVSQATKYRIQVVQGINPIIDGYVFTNSFLVQPGILQTSTEYSWRVKALNSADSSNFTSYWSFKTIATGPPNPPTPLTPTNHATDQTFPVHISWSPVSGASYYHLQVSINYNFIPPLAIDANGLTSTELFATQSQLQNGVQYFWRVNASNPGGTSNWSDVWDFTTIAAPPPPPLLFNPPNGANNITLTPLMTWQNVPNATSYHFVLASDANFNTVIKDTITGNNNYQVYSGLLWGSWTFYWKVASRNIGGEGNFSSPFHFTTIVGPPPAPQLVYPSDSAHNVPRFFTFQWNAASTATSYRIQASADPNFPSAGLLINATTTFTTYTVTANVFQNGQAYYWRVNASNNGGTGNWSQVWIFYVIPLPPGPPTLLSPPNGALNQPLTPLLDWTDVNGAAYYEVQIVHLSNTVLDDSTTASQYHVPPGVLQGGTQYIWRVRAKNSGGTSAWTGYWSFTTLVTQVSNLKVYLEGFYNGSTQVRDTIRVYLANATSPYAFRDSTVVYLGTDGTGTVSFTSPNGNYYIVIRHRNHLETWSSSPQAFNSGNPVNYDFTTSSSKAYGNNMKQVGSVWVFYGGDATQDGNIDVDDYNLFITQFGRDGYISCDLNGDNFADGYDLPILYSNLNKSKARP